MVTGAPRISRQGKPFQVFTCIVFSVVQLGNASPIARFRVCVFGGGSGDEVEGGLATKGRDTVRCEQIGATTASNSPERDRRKIICLNLYRPIFYQVDSKEFWFRDYIYMLPKREFYN